MTHETIGQALAQDHQVIDEHFVAFARSLDTASSGEVPLDTGALATGVAALHHHIYVEEEFHFPPLRAAGLMGPLLVMVREHGELWDLLDRLEGQVAESAPVSEISQTWFHMAATLEAHNLKEEQIVYPSGDQFLDTETSSGIRRALASGDTPDGWVCQMAGRGTVTPTNHAEEIS